MNAPSIDIKDILAAETALNLTFAVNLFYGKQPARPLDSVTVIDSYGFPSKLSLNNQGYEYPSVQIIVHNRDYDEGMQLAQNIKDLLHGRNHETWNGALYTVISCSSVPTLLGWDENGACNISINFNLQRRAV